MTALIDKTSVLIDKTSVPRIDIDLLPRTRLLDRLDKAMRRRAVVVAAPAGFGKTTALASWFQQRGSVDRLAWLTLGTADRDRQRFWGDVGTALGDIGPDVPAGGRAVDDHDFLSELMAKLARSREQVTLVLDDAHIVAGSPIVDDLSFVLRSAPPALRIVIIGRRLPAVQVARLRLSGELDLILSDDLAWTADEARDLLRVHGIAVDDDELSHLMRLTEGWIGGLRLALIGGGVAAEYIRDEFLGAQEPLVRLLLMRTSIADTLTAELAAALTGSADSVRALDQLSREHGFVKRVNAVPATFRYHPMVRVVLRDELDRELPHELPALFRTLGRWHKRNGRPLDELDCAVVSGDDDYLRQVLDEEDVGLLTSGSARTMQRFLLDLLAQDSTADPSIVTAAAIAAVRKGDLEDARALLTQAERTATAVPATSAPALRLKHGALRLVIAAASGRLDTGVRDSAWQLADSGTDARWPPAAGRAHGWLMAVLGVSHFVRGELQPARRALRDAERDFAAYGPSHLHERVSAWLAHAEAADGRLRSAARYAERVTETGGAADLTRAALVRLRLEEGDLTRAGDLLATLEPWQPEPLLGEPDAAFVMQALRLEICLANSDVAGACAAHVRLREAAGSYAPALTPAFAVLDPAISRTRMNPGASLDIVDWPSPAQQTIWLTARDLLLAWHAADEAPSRALEIVAACRDREGGHLRRRDTVSTLLVSAVAHRRLGDGESALRRLEEALALAEPDDARQVFIEGGNGVRVLLTAALPVESPFARFRAEVLERFERQLTPETSARTGAALTESERTVLRFLPTHRTNEEIASDLCLSVNTVKTHLRSIYRKLGVHSRRAAIAAASRRGLVLHRRCQTPSATSYLAKPQITPIASAIAMTDHTG